MGYGNYKDEVKTGTNNGHYHAETATLNKLPYRKSKKKKMIDLIVIRCSKTRRLSMSKPCMHCIHSLITITKSKGYQINNIYYSVEDGIIVKKFKDFIMEKDKHTSRGNR